MATLEEPKRKISLHELELHGGTINGNPYWTVIDGIVYDITLWRNRHPGGIKMIEMISGRDGTTFIETYHSYKNKPKVMATIKHVLSKYIVGSFVPNEDELKYEIMNINYKLGSCQFYNVLSKRIDDYFNEHNISYKASEWNYLFPLFILILYIYSFTQMWYNKPYYLQILWGILNGLLGTKMGFIMHIGNHWGYKTKFGNYIFGRFLNLLGLGRNMWILKHNVLHHISPNTFGIDVDAASGSPFLRLHPNQEILWYHKYQYIYILPIMLFLYIQWHFIEYINGIVFFLKSTHNGGKTYGNTFHFLSNGTEYIPLYLSKLYFIFMHIGFKILFIPYHQQSSYILTSIVSLLTLGASTGIILILNHIQNDLQHKLTEINNKHDMFIHINVLNSSNWSSGSLFWEHITAGLNHQIEHHLYPSMHPQNYPLISHIVRQTCNEFGLTYVDQGNLLDAIKNLINYAYIMGRS